MADWSLASTSPPPAPVQQPLRSSHLARGVGVGSRRFAPSDRSGPDRPQTRVVLVKGGSRRHPNRPHRYLRPASGLVFGLVAASGAEFTRRPWNRRPSTTSNPHVSAAITRPGTAPDS
jgi:hypothetical protein